jgi:hypothetical protein
VATDAFDVRLGEVAAALKARRSATRALGGLADWNPPSARNNAATEPRATTTVGARHRGRRGTYQPAEASHTPSLVAPQPRTAEYSSTPRPCTNFGGTSRPMARVHREANKKLTETHEDQNWRMSASLPMTARGVCVGCSHRSTKSRFAAARLTQPDVGPPRSSWMNIPEPAPDTTGLVL